MKKILSFAAVTAALVLASCNGGTNPTFDANDSTKVDSLTYYLGVFQGDGLKQYMTMQLQVDSTCINDFIKGMKDGAEKELSKSEDAYRKGLDVGAQIKQMAESLSKEVYANDSTKSVKIQNLLAGLIQSLKGEVKDTLLNPEAAYARFNALLEPIRTKNLEVTYADQKAANEKFLADNKKNADVVTLPSGLQYKVLVAGDGELPTDSTVVKCLYEGKLIDGTVFDSSKDDTPFEVNMAQPRVIEGWVEALKLMPAGSKWEVYIPQELAYGSQDNGQIKPFSTLIFTIETLK